MTGHVDAETLAAAREGLLPRRRAARVGEHVARCPECAELDQQLAGVTHLLADSPAPPMPAAVTARIEAALAAEAAGRSAAGAGAGAAAEPGHPGPAAPAPGRRAARPRRARAAHGRPKARPWLSPRLVAAAAAVAAVVGGGGYALSQLGPVNSGPSAAEGAPHRVASGGAGSSAKGEGAVPAASQAPPSLKIVRSGTNYLPGQLASQVGVALARSRPSPLPLHAGSAGTQPSAFSQSREANLPACVRRVTGGLTQRVVDLARYQGRPAAVIVATGAGGRPSHVWVVGPGCSGTVSDILAQRSLRPPG